MNFDVGDNSFWMCRLSPKDLTAWRNGTLDRKAKFLGIAGWIVPVKIDSNGNLVKPLWRDQSQNLLAAPLINLQHPLSPIMEVKLASQLQDWWKKRRTLKIMNKKFLVLGGIHNLSHVGYSIKRLKLSLPDTLIVGIEDDWKDKSSQQYVDFIVQRSLMGSQKNPANYLENIKKAHHSLKVDGMWMPSVKGVATEERLLWSNASASSYRQWVLQASAWSRIRYLENTEAPLIIDSWESHQRWWSREIKVNDRESNSVQLPENCSIECQWGRRERENTALMIHGFYLKKLREILDLLPPGGSRKGYPNLDLYISTPFNQMSAAKELLQKQGWPRVYLCGVPNRGRDIAPFLLNLLPVALKVNHFAFVKIHTKKSPHLKDGSDWSNHLVNSLLQPKFLSSLNGKIQNDPSLGLIAPPGTLLNSSVALGCNVDHLQVLLRKIRWSGAWALDQSYIAGSMMAGRLSALSSLEELGLTTDDFEQEKGQTDGTLAHAIERLISWNYLSKNLSIEVLPGDSSSVPKFGFGWI